jgi:hypothetical protein
LIHKRKEKLMDTFKSFISEAKLSRIFQYIENEDKDFGIVSSFRGEYSKSENLKRHADLKKRVRGMGLGFIEMKGGYIEGDTAVEELSLFIPQIKKAQIVELGKAFGQHSVMFKDGSNFVYIGTNEDAGVGKVLSSFKAKAGKENLNLSKDAIKDFYSQLTKGSHKGKKFVFNMESFCLYEQEEWNFAKAAYLKRGQQPAWIQII